MNRMPVWSTSTQNTLSATAGQGLTTALVECTRPRSSPHITESQTRRSVGSARQATHSKASRSSAMVGNTGAASADSPTNASKDSGVTP